MANEIGYAPSYPGSPGTEDYTVFTGEAKGANATGGGHYTASSGDTITKVRVRGRSSSGTPTIDIALYTVSGGLPATRIATLATITLTTSVAWFESGTLSQALTGGVTYALAIGNASASTNVLYAATGSNQSTNDTNLSNPWVDSSSSTRRIAMAADVSAGAGAVKRDNLFLFGMGR